MLKTIIALVILAFIIRILFIFQGVVSFHYDMARNAFVAEQIWKDNDLKILGPLVFSGGWNRPGSRSLPDSVSAHVLTNQDCQNS